MLQFLFIVCFCLVYIFVCCSSLFKDGHTETKKQKKKQALAKKVFTANYI